jgi:hypothetical protein
MKRVDTGDPELLEYLEPFPLLGTLAVYILLALPWAAFLGLIGYLIWSGNAGCICVLVTFPLFLAVRQWLGETRRPAVGADGKPLPLEDSFRLVFDRRRRTLTTSRMRWLSATTAEFPLDRFVALRISRGVTTDRGRSRSVYPLHLIAADGTAVHLERTGDYFAVRRLAEAVGAFLGLDVVDASSDAVVVLSVGDLGKPLALRRAARDPPPDLAPPPGLKGTCEVTADGMVFRTPDFRPSRVELVLLWGAAVGAVLVGAGVATRAVLQPDPYGSFSWWLCSGYLLVPGLLLLGFACLVTNVGPTVIRANAQGISVADRRPLFPSTYEAPADEVWEVALHDGEVKIITATASIPLGRYFAPGAAWLRAVLAKALAG